MIFIWHVSHLTMIKALGRNLFDIFELSDIQCCDNLIVCTRFLFSPLIKLFLSVFFCSHWGYKLRGSFHLMCHIVVVLKPFETASLIKDYTNKPSLTCLKSPDSGMTGLPETSFRVRVNSCCSKWSSLWLLGCISFYFGFYFFLFCFLDTTLLQ